jgi:hypothetical protein
MIFQMLKTTWVLKLNIITYYNQKIEKLVVSWFQS